ncbi:MAG TPA: hypothetical protein VG013_30285 [Gemmataceae bacterium]|jgi:hypothetical protein|nr:hypothetical protein [Gemmataceae bacterium]
MSDRSTKDRVRCRRPALALALVLGLACSPGGAADAAKDADKERPTTVGENASPAGVLLRWDASNKAWQPVEPKASVSSTEPLMALPASRAEVDIKGKKGTVGLSLWGNLPELSSFPGRESVVVLHADPDVDLNLSLERGRVAITNLKDKGDARVRVQFEDDSYDVTLEGKDSAVALELYGRWPRGIPFSREKPKKDNDKQESAGEEKPAISVVLHVIKGQADLKVGSEHYSLHAPPGPAFFAWDSLRGAARGPTRKSKLPAWAEPGGSRAAEGKAIQTAVNKLAARMADKPVETVLSDALDAADTTTRKLAVHDLAAIDDRLRLLDALGDTKSADVRQTAIDAAQHWIGRGPGQDRKLYNFLVKRGKYSEGQAEIVLQLLHDFGDDDWFRPETYETLIAYLRSSKLPIRELAMWQLYNSDFVPYKDKKKVPYDPAGSEEERERAFKAWKKLIPDGQLPQRPKGPTVKPKEKQAP